MPESLVPPPRSSRVSERLRRRIVLALAIGCASVLLIAREGHAQDRPAAPAAVAMATADDLRREAAELDERVAALRDATARFRDVDVALAEGYVRDPLNLCVSAPTEGLPRQLGGMGIHYFRPDILGLTSTEPRVAGTGTHTDFDTPGVLVYFPDEAGELRLGAIENVVFAGAWRESHGATPPSYHGVEYFSMVDNPVTEDVDEAHGFEPHYELHLWVHQENPLGVGSPFNPEVSCATYEGPRTMEEGFRWMMEHGSSPSAP